MSKTVRLARRVIIAAIGFPLLLLGIILIPLPGPGLITCFIAFLILSLEFDWAQQYLDKAKAELGKIYQQAKARADKIEKMGQKDDKK
jgi:uncharacterized protein (TIGR02611 family)